MKNGRYYEMSILECIFCNTQNEEQFVKMRTNIEGGTLCNDYEMRTTSECEVEKVDESFIYWFRNTGKTTKLKDISEEVCVVDIKDEYRKKIKNCLRE